MFQEISSLIYNFRMYLFKFKIKIIAFTFRFIFQLHIYLFFNFKDFMNFNYGITKDNLKFRQFN